MWLRRLPLARVAAASSAAALAGISLHHANAEASPPVAAAEEKPKQCLTLTLTPESSAAVLSCYPPEYSRTVADRVLVRPCMTVEMEACPLRPLAVLDDGSSQSILIVPAMPLWSGPADISSSGKVGYPVLPISIFEEEEEAPPPPPKKIKAASSPPPSPPPPPSPADAASNGAAATASASAAPTSATPTMPPPAPAPASPAPAAPPAAEEPAVPTLWEQIEEPWRLLEAAGVLTIDRDADSMPTSVMLAGGASAWQGELAGPKDAAPRTITVRLIDEAGAARLALRGRTLVPECGFCRFMKNGPCGDEFVAWEACVDKAKESGADFVEACGKTTLDLKACTDRHPEYYGMLGDDKEEDDDDDKPPPPKAS